MATFTVTIELDSTDEHEKKIISRDAVAELGTLHIEIDTSLITHHLPYLFQHALNKWAGGAIFGEIEDNGNRVGTYWTE